MIIIRTFFYFAANLAALLALNYLIDGFNLAADTQGLAAAAGILTLLNSYIRPVVKHFFTTFIILSLGLFTLFINAGVLLILDFLSESITISGLVPLLYSTAVITAANIIIGFLNWFLFKKND